MWSVLLSIVWALFVYYLPVKVNSADKQKSGKQFILPTLLFAPLLLFLCHKFFGLNLIFPVATLSSFDVILSSTIVPAFVLCIATGLFYNIATDVRRLKAHFYEASFSKLTVALGLSLEKRLMKLVVSKAMIDSWVTSLPWVFGEILIIEALFNAPGLGLDIWHMARMRNLEGFLEGIFWLLLIYFVISGVATIFSQRLGKRLEGYSS
jgi:ABC-type dipeptide/oligopeptide/nickel transport system permease component